MLKIIIYLFLLRTLKDSVRLILSDSFLETVLHKEHTLA